MTNVFVIAHGNQDGTFSVCCRDSFESISLFKRGTNGSALLSDSVATESPTAVTGSVTPVSTATTSNPSSTSTAIPATTPTITSSIPTPTSGISTTATQTMTSTPPASTVNTGTVTQTVPTATHSLVDHKTLVEHTSSETLHPVQIFINACYGQNYIGRMTIEQLIQKGIKLLSVAKDKDALDSGDKLRALVQLLAIRHLRVSNNVYVDVVNILKEAGLDDVEAALQADEPDDDPSEAGPQTDDWGDEPSGTVPQQKQQVDENNSSHTTVSVGGSGSGSSAAMTAALVDVKQTLETVHTTNSQSPSSQPPAHLPHTTAILHNYASSAQSGSTASPSVTPTSAEASQKKTNNNGS